MTQAPTNGVVAIGNRQIQGVADGEVSATSTNAVNGSQLFNVAQALSLGGTKYFHTNSTLADGSRHGSGQRGDRTNCDGKCNEFNR